MSDEPRIAPEGKLWVCTACGKTVKDRYGEPRSSWDESCMLNSMLVEEERLVRSGGRVVRILDAAPTSSPILPNPLPNQKVETP